MPKIKPGAKLSQKNVPVDAPSFTGGASSTKPHGRHKVEPLNLPKQLPVQEVTESYLQPFRYARAVASISNDQTNQLIISPQKPAPRSEATLDMYIYDGHASFELTKGDDTHIAAGFYPASAVGLVTGAGRIDSESYKAEAESEGWPLVTIPLTKEQADSAHNKITQYAKWCSTGDERYHYNPLTYNCADFVQDIYQWAEQDGHWLSHFSSDQLTKYGGIQNSFMALANKPYGDSDTVSDRVFTWTNNRIQGLARDPLSEISSNIMLAGVLIGVSSGIYSGCKSLVTYAGKAIASYSNQTLAKLNPDEMHQFIKEGMTGLHKISRAIEHLLDYSGDETCDIKLRKMTVDLSVDLDSQLDELEENIKFYGIPKSSPIKMDETIKKIDKLSENYHKLSQAIEQNPIEILGKEIRGNLKKTRGALNTVLNHLSCFKHITHTP